VTKKIAISMPEPMFRDMERARQRSRKERSNWVQEAIADRLKREQREADIAEYIRGYTEQPDGDEERAWAEAALKVGSTYDDEWPEAPR
jgi:metal-responsive CopG/Arc/MetJ family transcriptional regulator